jgi:hypothetical protein
VTAWTLDLISISCNSITSVICIYINIHTCTFTYNGTAQHEHVNVVQFWCLMCVIVLVTAWMFDLISILCNSITSVIYIHTCTQSGCQILEFYACNSIPAWYFNQISIVCNSIVSAIHIHTCNSFTKHPAMLSDFGVLCM